MRSLKLSNILFLIPALIIGPILLLALIAHGMILEQISRFQRRREIREANASRTLRTTRRPAPWLG
jgi:hypothetical protein